MNHRDIHENKKPETKKKQIRTNLLLVLIFLVGLGMVAYPNISDWINSHNASQAAATYTEKIEQTSDEEIQKLFKNAEAYNRNLATIAGTDFSDINIEGYEEQLKLDDSSVMATLTIPSIDLSLPVYHGTDEDALMSGIGHLKESSLPIGGPTTHTVLTGHRGMPSATLLTRLDELEEGDQFLIYTLGRKLVYEVDQIHVVVPEDIQYLKIEPGKDLATLVTCTPYGINTHRLLVRGHRISEELDLTNMHADAKAIDKMAVALGIGLAIVLVICLVWLAGSKRKRLKAEDFDDFDDEDIQL